MKKATTKVTEIQIIPIKPHNGLLAFASFVLDNKIYLSSVGIHSKLTQDGYRLTYPTKKVSNNHIQLFHPINKETSTLIERAIIKQYKKVMHSDDRYNSHNIATR
ncbi:MAG: septation protein SpoVG family protein [Patescibacteria group bacterium]